MRIFCMAVLAVLFAIIPMATALAEEVTEEVSVEDAIWQDWYGLAEAQGGMLWNFETEDWAPYLAFPVVGYRDVTGILGVEFDIDEKTDAKGVTAGVAGLTYHIGTLKDFGIALPGSDHVGLNVGIGGRYDFDIQEFETTAIISVLDLSFDNGNVDRQRSR